MSTPKEGSVVQGRAQAERRLAPVWGLGRWLSLSAILLTACANQADVRKADAHYKMGYSYLIDQQIQAAFVEFQKSVELNPNDRDAHYALGHVYFLKENFDDAEREFRRVIKLKSDDAAAWNYLGKVSEEQGKNDAALEYYDRALSFPQYPTPDLVHYNKGKVYLKRAQPEAALREFTAALRVNPTHVLAAFEAGRIYEDQSAVPQATAAYEIAVKQAPNFAEAYYHLAKVYSRAGKTDQARDAYRKVVELAPGSRWAEDANAQIAHPQ
jgi:type IV pilus assembly protein PilF